MVGPNFRQNSIETRRHRTAWIEAGPEHGPLMIFLHGWPESRASGAGEPLIKHGRFFFKRLRVHQRRIAALNAHGWVTIVRSRGAQR